MSKGRARAFSIPMEQHAVVRFFILKGTKAKDIKTELDEAYREEALSLSAVKKWRKRFVDGRTSLNDDPCPGRPCDSGLASPIQSPL
jgi:transposase